MTEWTRLQKVMGLLAGLSPAARKIVASELDQVKKVSGGHAFMVYGTNTWRRHIGKGMKRYWYGMSPTERRAEVKRRMG